MNIAARFKLRTKTGCFSCRRRRKKCDERTPVCESCLSSGRECVWPSSKDLVDRRFASQRLSQPSKNLPEKPPLFSTDDTNLPLVRSAGPRVHVVSSWTPSLRNLLAESAAAHGIVQQELELVLSRHFSQRYFYLLILPNCHSGFHDDWLAEIQALMVSHKSLYYSVMACAASYAHFVDASPRMQDLALNYYTNALGELSGLLAEVSSISGLESHNGLLMSVMLLYLHGCMGAGSYADIPQHLSAATRILTLRLFNGGAGQGANLEQTRSAEGPSSVVRCLFDRLAVESVLYQIFLVTTGLWSTGGGSPFKFDPEFWDRAEQLLDQSTLFPGFSTSFNSPVLGVPVPLFRLALSLSQLCHGRDVGRLPTLSKLRTEVELWVAFLLDIPDEFDNNMSATDGNEEVEMSQEAYYRDASRLFAMVVSLMLDHVARCGPGTGLPRGASAENSWQVRRALEILQKRRGDDSWCVSYLGNWPIYALGFMLDRPEERHLVRRELRQRWELTKFTQIMRFLDDLTKVWAERDASGPCRDLVISWRRSDVHAGNELRGLDVQEEVVGG